MKTLIYTNITTRLLVLLVTILAFVPAVAQDSRQYAIFNYRNDGSFNAFLNEEIDSISYSCIDTLGIEHDEVVVQEVWTPDSLYRIPIEAIDSLAFRAPAPKMRDNLFYIRDYHISHTLSLEDLTIYFNGTINNDSLPSVGQVVLCLLDEQPFDEGFAGRVMEVNRLGGRIEVVCAQASPCDVFERLVLVGMAVSDLNEYESKMKVRRRSDSSMGIEEIELPEKWKEELKVEFLDLLSITSKKPTVRYKYYSDISAFNFYIGGDIWIDHPDLTYKVTFDWDKISKLGKEYDEVKEIWNLFKEGNYDAIRLGEKEKNLEEKQWEKKIPIPFQAGPFDCVFEIGAMMKPEAVNLKANWEMKTSAFHHMGFFVQGHNPLAPSAVGLDEDWKKDGANDWYQKPCTSFKAEVDIEGSLAFGVFARLKASLLTKHLLRASVGAEAGLKLSYTGAFTLTDSDCDVPNVYGLLKDTNVGAKLYGKVKAEAGALPFNLINLQGELEYPFWESKFYLFPHFTEPTLTTSLGGYSRKDNEMFTTSVSKDLFPLLSCYPGLAFYSDAGNSKWDYREALYLDDIPYKFESDVSLLNEIEYSAYEAKLNPGETYRCYPVFKMFGHVWKAGPYKEFTYPKPLSMEIPSLILQKDAQQMVRINGGWGDYTISCEPKDIVKAEFEKSGNFSQMRITALKDGTATVKLFDKRSLESATVEVKVFGNPDEGAAITVSEEDIDFGPVAYGEAASSTFKVTNHGSVELAFNVNNSSTNINNGFIVNGANEIQFLQPGESMMFKVSAKGTGPDHFRMGVLYVYSNATKDPVSIGLKVKGKATSVKYVDLGLSVKWAECNLGALEAMSGSGDYFAWGETESKLSYGWDNYIHCDGTAATCHSLGNITGTDNDAAHYQWGGSWRLPTADELKELKEKCTWTWDNSMQMVGGMAGYWITGPNGNRIFLEAAGIMNGTEVKSANVGSLFFSGTPSDDLQYAYVLGFENENIYFDEGLRFCGASIRPVYDDNMQGLQLSATSLTLTLGSQGTVDVTSGSGSYAAVSNAKNVATVTVEGSKLVINAVAPGSATITVKDNQTQERAKIEVTVNESKSTIKVVPTEIDFGKVAVGTSKTEHFTVSNVGTSNFTFHVSEQHEIIDIPESGKEFTLAIGEEKIFEVIFTPTNPHGGYGAAVRVFSDAENGTQYIEIDGQGVEGGSEDDDAPEGVEAIDLGLPSGTKWASCNVGATKPEEYGGYYAWGETEEKEVYTRNNYKLNHASVVSNISGTQYDVAHVKWGGNWVMPTYEQQQELVDNCTSEWITLNGVNGRKITGPNGNSIFLPAAGFRGGDLWYAGVEGRYRSSTQYPKNSDQAYYLGFGSNYLNWGGGYRLEGYSVRPVIHSTPTLADLTLSSTGPITVKVDDKATVEITSGNGDYTAASDNEDVAIARVYDNATVMIKGISVGTATVSVTDTKSGQTAAITVTVTGTINPDVSPAEAIDLGLPSGTKWASCNVGASKPEEYGGLYAWGETEEKDVYNESTYKYYQDGSYVNLGSDISGTDYDVAHVKWGDNWVMPTHDEQVELLNNCKSEWTTENGVNGRRFTGPNGNSIFLPAAGWRWDGDLYDAGSYGLYWSSTQYPGSSGHAYDLCIDSGNAYWRYYGYRGGCVSVRPVVRN